MKKQLLAGAVLATGLSLVGSQSVSAQTGEWWNPVTVESSDAVRVLGDIVFGAPSGAGPRAEARYPSSDPRGGSARGGTRAQGGKAKKGNGPPFCRNGQGHPVHGRAWCESKGWAPANWNQVNWGNVVFGNRLPQQERRVTQPTITDILGSVVFGRVTNFARSMGLTGPVDGRWIPLDSGGSVLQLRVAGVPIAELADVNRDRRADVVFVNRIR